MPHPLNASPRPDRSESRTHSRAAERAVEHFVLRRIAIFADKDLVVVSKHADRDDSNPLGLHLE